MKWELFLPAGAFQDRQEQGHRYRPFGPGIGGNTALTGPRDVNYTINMKNLKNISLLTLGQLLLSTGFAAAETSAYSQLSGSALVQPPAVTAPYFPDNKSIYGDNSMQEYYQVSDQLKKMADSTVAFVLKKDLEFDPAKKVYKIKRAVTLLEASYADESEDFSRQGRLSNCTGSYLGKGLVMTAGHCFSVKPGEFTYFENFYMVFGWKYTEEGNPAQDFPADAVYSIKKVEAYALEGATSDLNAYRDFALVSMDGEPVGRQPLELAAEQTPKIAQKVFTIGYPLGLAVKIDNPDHAQVYVVQKNVFLTNIDAFGGNSGGPAFDSVTNKIVGIVITAVGAGYFYELNQDFSFTADFSLPSGLELKPESGTALFGASLRTGVLQKFRDAGASVKLIDENKCLLTLPKGAQLDDRSPLFPLLTELGGKSVFNKGKLIRFEQDNFGTGVLRLPKEITDLVRP